MRQVSLPLWVRLLLLAEWVGPLWLLFSDPPASLGLFRWLLLIALCIFLSTVMSIGTLVLFGGLKLAASVRQLSRMTRPAGPATGPTSGGRKKVKNQAA